MTHERVASQPRRVSTTAREQTTDHHPADDSQLPPHGEARQGNLAHHDAARTTHKPLSPVGFCPRERMTVPSSFVVMVPETSEGEEQGARRLGRSMPFRVTRLGE